MPIINFKFIFDCFGENLILPFSNIWNIVILVILNKPSRVSTKSIFIGVDLYKFSHIFLKKLFRQKHCHRRIFDNTQQYLKINNISGIFYTNNTHLFLICIKRQSAGTMVMPVKNLYCPLGTLELELQIICKLYRKRKLHINSNNINCIIVHPKIGNQLLFNQFSN